jgi:hypothetical protein
VLTAALVLGALLAVAAVWFVARPFLARTTSEQLAQPDDARLALEEERDRALAALKELEFDHRTGKVSDEDYRRQVVELRRDAAEALRALESGRRRRDVSPDDGVDNACGRAPADRPGTGTGPTRAAGPGDRARAGTDPARAPGAGDRP